MQHNRTATSNWSNWNISVASEIFHWLLKYFSGYWNISPVTEMFQYLVKYFRSHWNISVVLKYFSGKWNKYFRSLRVKGRTIYSHVPIKRIDTFIFYTFPKQIRLLGPVLTPISVFWHLIQYSTLMLLIRLFFQNRYAY